MIKKELHFLWSLLFEIYIKITEQKFTLLKVKALSREKAGCQEEISPASRAFELFGFEVVNL